MRTKDFEDTSVPIIMEAVRSGKATSEELTAFQIQLLAGILMALNDLLTLVAQPRKQGLNVYTLPIVG